MRCPTLAVVLAICGCAASIPVRRRDLARAAIRGRAEGQIALDVPAKFAIATATWTNVKQRSKPTASPTAAPISLSRPPSRVVVPTTKSTTVSSATKSAGPTPTPLPAYWAGASSYFLHALQTPDRLAVLDAMKAANLKVVRIFIGSIYYNAKGSGNPALNDVEPNTLGVYDDTILQRVDQLMVECQARGMKLQIVLHDRWFWSADAFSTTLGITKSTALSQKIANAMVFYKSTQAISFFDKRIQHIMSHQNALMGGKTWAQLSEVIHSFEPQNEPLGYVPGATNADFSWVCDRAATIKKALPASSPILVSSGGGTNLQISTGAWAMKCASLDVVSVHSYDNTDLVNNIGSYLAPAKANGKQLIVGEWGALGSSKASNIKWVGSTLKKLGLPWQYWQVVRPGNPSDFEIWTSETAAWSALAAAAAP